MSRPAVEPNKASCSMVTGCSARVVGSLTLSPLLWRIWRSPSNASRYQMGFNSAFKG